MIVIFLVGLGARLCMLLSSKSLWGDEIYSVTWALKSDLPGILMNCFTVNHPPLYYFLVHLFLRTLGEHEFVLRLPSFLSGLVTLWTVYWLGKKLFGKPAGRAAALLAAVSPYFLQSSNEIRPYSVLAMISALILVFLFKSLKKKSYWIVYTVLCVMITYVEHVGVFIVLATAVYLAAARRKDALIPQAAVFLFQVPWVFLVFRQAIENEKILQVSRIHEYWNLPWMLKKTVGIFWHFFCGYQFSMLTVDKVLHHIRTSPVFWLQAVLTLAGVLALATSFLKLYAGRRDIFWFCTSTILMPFFLLLIFYPIRLDARYLHFAAPLIFVLTGAGLWAWKPRWVPAFFLSAFTVASLGVDLHSIGLKTDPIHKEDFKSMVAYVSKRLDSRSAVLGSVYHHDYLVKFLGFDASVRYFGRPEELSEENTSKLDSLWYLKEMNMHSEVSERILSDDAAYLKTLGFFEKERIRFGGEEGLTLACLYVKR